MLCAVSFQISVSHLCNRMPYEFNGCYCFSCLIVLYVALLTDNTVCKLVKCFRPQHKTMAITYEIGSSLCKNLSQDFEMLKIYGFIECLRNGTTNNTNNKQHKLKTPVTTRLSVIQFYMLDCNIQKKKQKQFIYKNEEKQKKKRKNHTATI